MKYIVSKFQSSKIFILIFKTDLIYESFKHSHLTHLKFYAIYMYCSYMKRLNKSPNALWTAINASVYTVEAYFSHCIQQSPFIVW